MFYLSTSIQESARDFESDNRSPPSVALLIGIDGRRFSVDGPVDVFYCVFIREWMGIAQLKDRAFSIQQVLPAGFDIVAVAVFYGNEPSIEDFEGSVRDGWVQQLTPHGFTILSLSFEALVAPIQSRESIGSAREFSPEYSDFVDRGGGVFWKRPIDMNSGRLTVRVKFSVPWSLNCQESWNSDELEQEIRRYFDCQLANLFVDRSWFMGFRTSDDGMVMVEMKDDTPRMMGSTADTVLTDLLRKLKGISKRKDTAFHQDVIDGVLLEKVTQSEAMMNGTNGKETEMKIVPIVQYEAGDFLRISVPQKFEIIVVCNEECRLSSLPSLALESFRRLVQLRLKQTLKYSKLKERRICVLEPFYFLPQQCSHYVVNYYPRGWTDDQLELERRELHSLLSLPLSRPSFRKLNRYRFPHEYGPYLINVHECYRDKDPGIGATLMSSVRGPYEYRHYMQDHFDDKNWGCAYRSFQTIWSWFLLNGYTEKPVPSHREIQQALVDIGDREPNFVGSRQWIGSLELSYCLDHLASITSKIVSVNSGDEMAEKARELYYHFQTEGTPVMIGGGVLAHTILGVAYDEGSGVAKFLILDPHYTGDENLQVITDKGWCGWKPVSFWDKNAFYNMMLPIRPKVF